MSRRVFNQRRHLEVALPSLLQTNPTYQLWFITAAAADSRDVTAHSKSAVLGMKRLLKHGELKSRVISHFSVLEVALKRGRPDGCHRLGECRFYKEAPE